MLEMRPALRLRGETAMSGRRELPARRELITQKFQIAGRRTLYVTVHDDPVPAEVFLRVRGADCPDEIVALYDCLARMMSLALQHGAPLSKIGHMLEGVQASPAGPVQGDARIRFCRSLPDLIGRHLLIECCGREDLAHG
jgi:ribonucleoside-diphosphate reductase alpha chain